MTNKTTPTTIAWETPVGATFAEMQDNARKGELYKRGDMRLVWVNEADLHLPISPTTQGEAADASALVARLRLHTTWRDSHGELNDAPNEAAAALTARDEQIAGLTERLAAAEAHQSAAIAAAVDEDIVFDFSDAVVRDILSATDVGAGRYRIRAAIKAALSIRSNDHAG